MSPGKIIGLALLIVGGGLAYLGLYSSDSLLLLTGSVLHFFEHMQLMWSDMAVLPRVYLAAGLVLFVIGLLLLLKPGYRNPRGSEFF